jgi:hypothetical protein
MTGGDETLDLVRALDSVAMSQFSIVGSYARYGEQIRQTLKDARVRIVEGC